jgi:hypothetical protein
VERWATAVKLQVDRNELEIDISGLSSAWRKAALPSTNKLHLLEVHLADFLELHRSWGLFGEQGVESLHHVANIASERCFGINARNKLVFFMKRQLMTSFTDPSEFGVRQRNRSGTPASEVEVFLEDEIDVAYEEEVEWYDDNEI